MIFIKKDEWAYILDFLSRGYYGLGRSMPVAQVIGEKYFSLLEVIVRDGVTVSMGERVYIGDGKREKIKFIKRRLEYNDLTGAAKSELEGIVETIVKKNEKRFVEFFNRAKAINTRMHTLQLLPGIGKKHLWDILEKRKEKPFNSFEDMKRRISSLPDPKKLIVRRIVEELEDKDRYRLFVPRFEKGL